MTTKDEMKNRISMALKDPILQQGFEIICKENELLKCRTEGFEKQILGLLYKYESVYKRFPDLKDAMNKAERPKWHDLRKDPNDLPKVNQKVLLQIKDEGRPIIDFYTRYGVWNFANEYEAIAWCEIPKFDEE